jgi:4-amino-4-deoxy-L-arabinose transferase-like glycosyltransferase
MIDHISDYYTKNRHKIRDFALFIISIVVALAGQITLFLAKDQPGFWEVRTWLQRLGENSSPLPGLLLYFLAGLIFVNALHSTGDTQKVFTFSTVIQKSQKPRFGFWITSLGLAGLTAFYTANSTPTAYALAYGIVVSISVYLLFISVFFDERWRIPNVHSIYGWIIVHRSELFIIITILVAAFFIRFLNLEYLPYPFINDEGEMGRNASCLIQGTCIQIMEVGWSQQPMMAFLPTGLSISLFGNTVLAVRLVSIVIGTLAVLAVYLFTRDVFDKKTAWVAGLLLATLPVHVHFSRLGVDNIIDSLSTTLMLWLLFRGIKRNSTLSFLMAGIIGGLCFYTYPGTRLAPIISLFILGYICFYSRGFLKAYNRKLLILLLAFAIVSAPILGFFITHPEKFSARMDIVSIFRNNALQNEIKNTDNSVFDVLTSQFMKSSLVFIVTSAPSNFYNSPKPYLVSAAAIFFMLGLAYTLWRIKDPRYLGLLTWFLAAIILGSTLTGGPPTSQRMLMSTSGLAIITAIGVTKSTEFIPKTGRFFRWIAPLSLLIFVLYVGYQNINFYFYEYQIGHFFEDPTNELTYEIRTFIAPLHDTGRFYLIAEAGVPYLSFASINYFSPDVEKAYFDQVTPQTLAALPKDKDALFIATSTRGSDMYYLSHLIPGGEWHEFRRRFQPDEVLFYSYQIDKNILQGYKP